MLGIILLIDVRWRWSPKGARIEWTCALPIRDAIWFAFSGEDLIYFFMWLQVGLIARFVD